MFLSTMNFSLVLMEVGLDALRPAKYKTAPLVPAGDQLVFVAGAAQDLGLALGRSSKLIRMIKDD